MHGHQNVKKCIEEVMQQGLAFQYSFENVVAGDDSVL